MPLAGFLETGQDSWDGNIAIAVDGNGNLYTLHYAHWDTQKYEVWKSTDHGESWTKMDGAHAPARTGYYVYEVIPEIYFDNDVIVMIHGYNYYHYGTSPNDYYQGTISVNKFYMSHSSTTPDTWATQTWTFTTTNHSNAAMCRWNCVINPATHDAIIYYTNAIVVSSIYRDRVVYAKLVGTTMTPNVNVDGLATNSTDESSPYPEYVDQNGRVWFYYYIGGGVNAYRLRCMSSAYSLGTARATTYDYLGGLPFVEGGTGKLLRAVPSDSFGQEVITTSIITEASDGATHTVSLRNSVAYPNSWTYAGQYWDTTYAKMLWLSWRGDVKDQWCSYQIDSSENVTYVPNRQEREYSEFSTGSYAYSQTEHRLYYLEYMQISGDQYFGLCLYFDYNITVQSLSAEAKAATISPTVLWTNLVSLPTTDIQIGTWTDQDGSPNLIYAGVDDYPSLSNTDYINSRDDFSSNDKAVFKLSALTALGSNIGVLKFSYWVEAVNPMLGSVPSRNLRVRLFQSDPPGDYNMATAAHGASATADSTYPGYWWVIPPSLPPSATIDENDSTWWESNHVYNGSWLKIDLGQARNISHFYLYVNSRVLTFRISYSNNDSDYTVLGTYDNTQALTMTLSFAPVNARYWKMIPVTYNAGDDGFAVHTWAMYLSGQYDQIDICNLVYTNVSSATPVIVEHALTSEEQAKITDLSKLYVEFEGYST